MHHYYLVFHITKPKNMNIKQTIFSIFMLGVMLSTQATLAQDKVHLKNDYLFKQNGQILYEGKANESFRLRAISKKRLQVELPDKSIVEISPKEVLEDRNKFVVEIDCDLREKESKKSEVIEHLKKGDTVTFNKAFVHSTCNARYRVKTAAGNVGFADKKFVRPTLRYVIAMNSPFWYLKLSERKDKNMVDIIQWEHVSTIVINKDDDQATRQKKKQEAAKERDQAIKDRVHENYIPLKIEGEFIRLRAVSDGQEGWVRAESVKMNDIDDYIVLNLFNWVWLHDVLSHIQLSSYSWVNYIIFLVMGIIWAYCPFLIVFKIFVKRKWVRNGMLTFLLVLLPGLLYLLAVDDLRKYLVYLAPGTFVNLIYPLLVLVGIYLSFKKFRHNIIMDRCSKCRSYKQNTILDVDSDSATTITAREYSDGRKTEQKTNVYITRTLKRCDICGAEWKVTEREVVGGVEQNK